jgi:hypothetical protein
MQLLFGIERDQPVHEVEKFAAATATSSIAASIAPR